VRLFFGPEFVGPGLPRWTSLFPCFPSSLFFVYHYFTHYEVPRVTFSFFPSGPLPPPAACQLVTRHFPPKFWLGKSWFFFFSAPFLAVRIFFIPPVPFVFPSPGKMFPQDASSKLPFENRAHVLLSSLRSYPRPVPLADRFWLPLFYKYDPTSQTLFPSPPTRFFGAVSFYEECAKTSRSRSGTTLCLKLRLERTWRCGPYEPLSPPSPPSIGQSIPPLRLRSLPSRRQLPQTSPR